MSIDNSCWTCQALTLPHPSFSNDMLAQLRNDHQFAQHARQISMFNDPLGGSLAIEHTKPLPEMIEAMASRESGMAKSERGIDPEFQRFARDRLVIVAKGYQSFTSDDIWQRMPAPFDREHYREPRHMGIITSWGNREGYMKRTEKYVPTSSRKANMTLHTLWTSLVFEGERINGG